MLKIIVFLLFFLTGSTAHAVKDFNIKNSSQSYLFVNGTTGNVGIGSAVPGKTLDIQGTLRTSYFRITNLSATTGYALTASDSEGNVTWGSPQSVSGWTITNNDVYETNGGNVGIGTTLTTTSALTVMNGNVGIGTWKPEGLLSVGSNAFSVDSSGAITATTGITTSGGYTQSGSSLNAFSGNLGIGSASPGEVIDVQGTVRMLGGGAVGIGTTLTTTSSLTVMGGNVGIGTWKPQGQFQVSDGFVIHSVGVGTAVIGRIGIGTVSPEYMLQIKGDSNSTDDTVFPTLRASNPSTSGRSLAMYQVSGNNDAFTAGFLVDGIGAAAFRSVPAAGLVSLTSQPFMFAVNSTEAMRVEAGGNIGIGTWKPVTFLEIGARKVNIDSNGNVGMGSVNPNNSLIVSTGNVGVATAFPGKSLDIQGTVRVVGFAMRSQNPASGYLLTASDSSGNATWTAPATVSGWTVSGSDLYETAGGNVGIGTNLVTTSALTVMNGNVGIGTWKPTSTFVVIGSWEDAFTTVSSDTTLDKTHHLVDVDCTGGPVTITLPTAVGIDGRCYKIKDWKGQAATNNITIATTAAQTIDTNSNVILNLNYQSYDVCSDGANWLIF